MANTWQGPFLWQNLAVDGFERASPVGSYSPNGIGSQNTFRSRF
jgi:sulfatase modifying factor 1